MYVLYVCISSVPSAVSLAPLWWATALVSVVFAHYVCMCVVH